MAHPRGCWASACAKIPSPGAITSPWPVLSPPRLWEAYTVPASTWAIFPGRGPASGIQQLERRIITEWLPTSGYEYADAPDLEVYQNPDPRDAQYEIWIPVAPKP